jgi:hypothetical protein
MVAPTCFGIKLPSSGSVRSAFWEMLNWGAVDIILWMDVLCLVTLVRDWLRAGRSGDQIPAEARFFAHVQTGRGAHPASCTMGTGSFPGAKRPGRGADHPPLLAPRSRMSRAIPLLRLWACYRAIFTFTVTYCQGPLLFFVFVLLLLEGQVGEFRDPVNQFWFDTLKYWNQKFFYIFEASKTVPLPYSRCACVHIPSWTWCLTCSPSKFRPK